MLALLQCERDPRHRGGAKRKEREIEGGFRHLRVLRGGLVLRPQPPGEGGRGPPAQGGGGGGEKGGREAQEKRAGEEREEQQWGSKLQLGQHAIAVSRENGRQKEKGEEEEEKEEQGQVR